MHTMRAPRKCAEHFRQRDPNTAINESFIRRLIKNGDIPCIRNGKKILVSVESIDAYLSETLSGGINEEK